MTMRHTNRRCGSLPALLPLGVLTMLGGVACSSRQPAVNEVAVTGTDYAFTVPDSLPPGQSAFRFINAGQVPHEMVLVRLKDGVTLPEVLQAAAAGANPDDFTEGGVAILIASPGDTARTRILVDLVAGHTYALICSFTDGEGQPPHETLGMAKSIRIAAE